MTHDHGDRRRHPASVTSSVLVADRLALLAGRLRLRLGPSRRRFRVRSRRAASRRTRRVGPGVRPRGAVRTSRHPVRRGRRCGRCESPSPYRCTWGAGPGSGPICRSRSTRRSAEERTRHPMHAWPRRPTWRRQRLPYGAGRGSPPRQTCHLGAPLLNDPSARIPSARRLSARGLSASHAGPQHADRQYAGPRPMTAAFSTSA